MEVWSPTFVPALHVCYLVLFCQRPLSGSQKLGPQRARKPADFALPTEIKYHHCLCYVSGYSPKQKVRWQIGRGQKPQGQTGSCNGGGCRGERGPWQGSPGLQAARAGKSRNPSGARPEPQPRAPAGGPLPRRCGGESPPWPRRGRRLFRRRRLLRVLRGSASAGRCRRRHEAGGGGRCGAGGMAGRGRGLRRLRSCGGTGSTSWSCSALSCPALPCHVMPCLALPCCALPGCVPQRPYAPAARLSLLPSPWRRWDTCL